jgi:beta-lactam-binding protein with PASTA domain
MPDVRGMSTGDATAQLQGMGLEVRVVQSCPGGSTVVETHPIAGTKIREGTRVALFVC